MFDGEVVSGDEALIKEEPLERPFRQAAYAGEDAPPQLPADDDGVDVPGPGQFHGDVDGVGANQDVPLGSLNNKVGQLDGGGAAVQKHRFAVGDAVVGRPGDGFLLLQVAGQLLLVGKLPQGTVGAGRASPGPPQRSFLLHGHQELPDGDLGERQGLAEFGNRYGGLLLQLP